MLCKIDSEILAFFLLFSIYVDLKKVKSASEHEQDAFFRHATACTLGFLIISILCTLLASPTLSIPFIIIQVVRTVQIIAFPLMVFLWLHYILSHFFMNARLFRINTIIASIPMIGMMVLAVGDQFWHRFFVYGIDNRPIGGYGFLFMVILCIIYSIILLVMVFMHAGKMSRDKTQVLLTVPVMYILAMILLYRWNLYLPFNIAMAITVFAIYQILQKRRFSYDTLTGVLNRKSFLLHLEHVFSRGHRCSLVVVDIENFKFINHRCGYENGDRLLVELASYLESKAPNNRIYRIGGDQFALVLWKYNEQFSQRLIHDIQEHFSHPLEFGAARCLIKLHFAIVLFPAQVQTVDDALNAIAFTLSEAKSHHSDGVVIFNEKLLLKHEQMLGIRDALRRALITDSLFLAYQPIYDVHTMRIVGAEALLRMTDQELGSVSPGEFVPVAEETGLIVEMTDKVISKVCGLWDTIDAKDLSLDHISVNLSAVNFLQPSLEQHLLKLIGDAHVNPQRFEFELTESAVLGSSDNGYATILSMVGQGIGFALDDYGKGFSNIELLLKLPFKTVKLDRSIVNYCESHQAFLESLILMLHKIDRIVVAEGVETENQFRIMKGIGVDRIQGYYLGRPMLEQDLLARLPGRG